MSPNHIVRHFRILASIAAYSFATCAGAKPAQGHSSVPEKGSPPGRVAPGHPKAKSGAARLAKSTGIHTRPENASQRGVRAAETAGDIYERGIFAMQVGQNAEAIEALGRAVKKYPSRADAWAKLTMLHLKEGNVADAIEAFKQAKRFGDLNGTVPPPFAVAVLWFR